MSFWFIIPFLLQRKTPTQRWTKQWINKSWLTRCFYNNFQIPMRAFFSGFCLFVLSHVCLGEGDLWLTPIINFSPDQMCDLEDIYNSSKMYGIHLGLVKQTFETLGWTEWEDYYFKCTEFLEGRLIIESDDSALWKPGPTITSARLKLGWVFSQVQNQTNNHFLVN